MALDIKLKEEAFTPPPAPVADPDPIPQPSGREIIDLAKYEDISRRLIMGQKSAEIAADIGYSDRHLRRILHRPEFLEVYTKVSAKFYDNMDEVMMDEKLRPIHRAQAMAVRSLTLLSEVQKEVSKRIEDGTARATDLKVGVDAAFGIIDRSKGELSPQGTPQVAVQFNINQDKKALLRSVVAEAGVDLSDLGVIDITPSNEERPPPLVVDEEPPTDGK